MDGSYAVFLRKKMRDSKTADCLTASDTDEATYSLSPYAGVRLKYKWSN